MQRHTLLIIEEEKMKKRMIMAVTLLVFFAASAAANQLALGYNNEGPTARFKWDDNIVSELSVSLDYNSNPSLNPSTNNNISFTISPINLTLYRGQFGDINIGFKFKNVVHYEEGLEGYFPNQKKYTKFTANDYYLYLMLPELELSVPGVENMKLIGSLGISTGWKYADNGKLESFSMGL
jgi:hypothetical protein